MQVSLLFPTPKLTRIHYHFVLVNLLPTADYIIALGPGGNIVEQGTFARLNAAKGYVKSFAVQKSTHKHEATEPRGKLRIGSESASSLVDAMDDKKRQLGEFSVYRYYFHTVGRLSTTIFFTIALIYGFLFAFPCELPCLPALDMGTDRIGKRFG